MDYKIIHEEKYQQFTAKLEQDKEAEIAYAKPEENVLNLMHTFVPEPYRGQGVAQQLVTTALQYARQNNCKVIATCGVVKEFLKENPEYQDLLR